MFKEQGAGCKFVSSVVYLQGGGRKFGPDIRT